MLATPLSLERSSCLFAALQWSLNASYFGRDCSSKTSTWNCWEQSLDSQPLLCDSKLKHCTRTFEMNSSIPEPPRCNAEDRSKGARTLWLWREMLLRSCLPWESQLLDLLYNFLHQLRCYLLNSLKSLGSLSSSFWESRTLFYVLWSKYKGSRWAELE